MKARDDVVDSIEQHAVACRRYHPVIIVAFKALFATDPAFIKSLFKVDRDLCLFVSAMKRATVHVVRTKSIISGRRAPGKRKNPSLEFHGRFHREFASFFRNDGLARQALLASIHARARRKQEQITAVTTLENEGKDRESDKTGSTPCFMLANHAIWASGVLNKPGRHVGNTFDLSTYEGFVFLMHEIFHTMQWYRSPLRFVLGYLKAFVRSLSFSDGHIPWAHEVIGFEVEAIAFHERLWDWFVDHPRAGSI
nr:hypothetical protein [Candidatus Sigynarchaeota archaeon]